MAGTKFVARADTDYAVFRSANTGHIMALRCGYCREFAVNVKALHRRGDKSGAARYCRARAEMVKHLYAEHRESLARHQPTTGEK